MNWQQLAGPLAEAGLTALGAALGGPAGAITATLGKAMAEALGVEASPERVVEAIRTDPSRAAEALSPLNAEADALLSKQLDLNARQAESGAWFVSAARPAMMWVCVLALLYASVGISGLTWATANFGLKPPPEIPGAIFETVAWLAFALFGVRAAEKFGGVARSSLTEPMGRTNLIAAAGAAAIEAVARKR